MSETVQITCRVTHKIERYLALYAAERGFNQTKIIEQALSDYVQWYENKSPEERLRPLAYPSTGLPYRGYVDSELKQRITAISDKENYPLNDLYYSALCRLVEQQGYDETTLVRCFISHDLADFFGVECLEQSESASELLHRASQVFLERYARLSPKKREALMMAVAPLEEAQFIAYLPHDTFEALERIKETHHLSLRDVCHHILQEEAQRQGHGHREVMLTTLRKDALSALEHYETGQHLKRSELFEQAIQEFVTWYEGPEREASWKPDASLSTGSIYKGYVSRELVHRLRTLPFSLDDLAYTAVMTYADRRDLVQSSLKKLLETPGKDRTRPGVCVVFLLPEQEEVIRFMIGKRLFKNNTDFYQKAALWWIEQRHEVEGLFDAYLSRPVYSEGDNVIEVSVVLNALLHQTLAAYGKHDGQSIRNVYYNMIIGYMDHLLDTLEQDQLSHDISHIKL